MVKKFKYGFDYGGIRYGWNKKKLFRLPTFTESKKSLPLKELNLIDVGNKKGYRVSGDRKTIDQLMEITERIDYTYEVSGNGSDDCPF